MKLVKIFIFYFLLTIYSVEILLFFFTKEQLLSTETVMNKRIEIAKKMGINYDSRTPEEAFLDLKKTNKNLEPIFYYSPIFRFTKTFNDAKKNNKLIPFRGPINSKSLTCAEDLKYKLVNNDKFGFKNSNLIYEKNINSILLGDSYAEGKCQNSENDIAGNLTKIGFNTVNLGVSGTSTLVSLGIMREFGKFIKPKNFIYLYYEGNDLKGLDWEKNDEHLISYLKNDNYTVNYLKKYNEIKNYLKLSSSESIYELKKPKKNMEKNNSKKIEENLIDILELKKIKQIVRYNIFKTKYTKHNYDLDFYFSVVKKMNEEAKKLNGNFIFVYVPNYARYISYTNSIPAYLTEAFDLKEEILKEVKKLNIPVIDLMDFFDNAKNVEQYYPLGYIGHFNAKGYKKIAELISKKIK